MLAILNVSNAIADLIVSTTLRGTVIVITIIIPILYMSKARAQIGCSTCPRSHS